MDMIVVIAKYGEEIESFRLGVSHIESAIDLVRKYGYVDKEGNTYSFEGAHVEENQRLVIHVEETE